MFQRQLGDKDKLISQLHSHKTTLENEISHYEAIVKEKEDVISTQQKSIEQLRSEIALANKKV